MKASVFLSLGMIFGGQLGVSVGFNLSNNVLAKEGNRERIMAAFAAVQKDLEAQMRPNGKPGPSRKQRELYEGRESSGGAAAAAAPEVVDGENTALAMQWEKDQALPSSMTDSMEGTAFVDEPSAGRSSARGIRPVAPPLPAQADGGSTLSTSISFSRCLRECTAERKTSRWEELRTSSQPPSAWAAIRQRNAREDLPADNTHRNSAPSRSPSMPSAGSQAPEQYTEIKGRDYAAEQRAFDGEPT